MVSIGFKGSFSISPQVVFKRQNETLGKAHYLLIEKAFKSVEDEIKALPSSLKLAYTSGDRYNNKINDQICISFTTQYGEKYEQKVDGWVSIDGAPESPEKAPEVAILNLIKKAIAKAKEDIDFFKVQDLLSP